jgi:hypothetical protein
MPTIPILKNYPIKINNTAIPFSGSMSEKYDTIENVNTSEAGTDVVQLTRVGKLTTSISYTMLSDFIPTLEGWRDSMTALSVKIFDFGTGGYKERSMRMRNYKKDIVKHSQDLTVTTGIWKVSFDLIEI